MPSIYNNDDSLPYWQNNVCAESIFEAFSHRQEKAKAWLRYRNVSETSNGFKQAVMMHGHFEGGILGNHTYHWTFTPGSRGGLAIVVPVYEAGRIIDFVAIARNDHNIWGCCTGFGRFAGQFVGLNHDRALPVTLHVYQTPLSWLRDGVGILPLAKSFFPMLQFAQNIVACDGDHAFELANRVFIEPAESFGFDVECAEQAAFDRISFGEVAA